MARRITYADRQDEVTFRSRIPKDWQTNRCYLVELDTPAVVRGVRYTQAWYAENELEPEEE